MDGISVVFNENYSLYYVNKLSDEIKEAIRTHLACICHGKDEADSGHYYASYYRTIKDFLTGFDKKTEKQKKGQIGELLTHIIIRTHLPEYEICSAFFNMEESSAKKGFDLVIIKDMELWLNEVKSGEPNKEEDSNSRIKGLIRDASSDLINRISNTEDCYTVWREAINGAKKVISETNSRKGAIIKILSDSADESYSGMKPQNCNVILSAVLFNTLEEKFEECIVTEKVDEIIKNKSFQSLYIIAIQEEAYQQIALFLRDEASNE